MATAWTESRPDAENWTAYQVVCHLAYIEEEDSWRVNLGVLNRPTA